MQNGWGLPAPPLKLRLQQYIRRQFSGKLDGPDVAPKCAEGAVAATVVATQDALRPEKQPAATQDDDHAHTHFVRVKVSALWNVSVFVCVCARARERERERECV